MQPWGFILLWIVLSLGSLAYFAYLGYRLFKKGLGVIRVGEPVLVEAKKLAAAIQNKPSFEKPDDNLFDDVDVHLIERSKLIKARKLKAEGRQRRLIEHLRDIDTQESEFTNGRT
jgi:hypothetical protein